jgi:hypothetical protein
VAGRAGWVGDEQEVRRSIRRTEEKMRDAMDLDIMSILTE